MSWRHCCWTNPPSLTKDDQNSGYGSCPRSQPELAEDQIDSRGEERSTEGRKKTEGSKGYLGRVGYSNFVEIKLAWKRSNF